VHWCRCGVRFNEVPEKAPKVIGEGLGGFGADNRVLEKVRGKVPEKVGGGFGAEPGKFSQSSGEEFRGRVPERFQRRSRSLRRLSGSTGFWRRLGRRFRRRFGRLWCRAR